MAKHFQGHIHIADRAKMAGFVPPELPPCPLCGGQGEYVFRKNSYYDHVRCTDATCKIYGFVISIEHWLMTPREANTAKRLQQVSQALADAVTMLANIRDVTALEKAEFVFKIEKELGIGPIARVANENKQ
jgi:hypothetical protein